MRVGEKDVKRARDVFVVSLSGRLIVRILVTSDVVCGIGGDPARDLNSKLFSAKKEALRCGNSTSLASFCTFTGTSGAETRM